jgi:hypothetical protein
MIDKAIIHDNRLLGRAPGSEQGYRLYRVNRNVSLVSAFRHIANDSRSHGGIQELLVMCHGYESHENEEMQMSTIQARGGYGLQLGTEGLSRSNVWLMASLKDKVQKIIIYSCATADIAAGGQGSYHDGREFCREIALVTNAEVIASSAIQMYNPNIGVGRIDFSSWEGSVYNFSPSGVVSPYRS